MGFIFVWVCTALLALVLFGRVVWLERQNPATSITYIGAAFVVAVSLVPLAGAVITMFCLIEFPHHFALATRTIYKGDR